MSNLENLKSERRPRERKKYNLTKGNHLMTTTVPIERITSKIYLIRGQKVMLDRELAELYEVETSQLKRAVRRNADRFPEDFMLTRSEVNKQYPIDIPKGRFFRRRVVLKGCISYSAIKQT